MMEKDLLFHIDYYQWLRSKLLLFNNLQIARTIGDYYSEVPQFGGKSGTNINLLCINRFKIDDKSDFILLRCKFI